MSNHTNNNANIQSLENSISVYTEYRSKIPTSHMTDELKQAKIQELDKQISECESTIERLKQDVN
jgi:TolA-binding protein